MLRLLSRGAVVGSGVCGPARLSFSSSFLRGAKGKVSSRLSSGRTAVVASNSSSTALSADVAAQSLTTDPAGRTPSTAAAAARIVTAPRKRSTLANVRQKPLFPGMHRHVTRFEGEHVYNYGKHTFTICTESSGMAVVPAGCLFAYLLSWFPSFPVLSWEMQVGYLVVLALASRLVSRGRANRVQKDLTGRTVLVTGGTSGIGRATAAQLAKMGANLILLAPDHPEHVESALAYISKYKKHKDETAVDAATPTQSIRFHALDVSDLIAVRDYCKRLRAQHQPIDILVNNAGVLQQHHVTTRFGDDVQLAVNFLGPYLLTEGLLPLVEAAQGRIVYVSCSAHVGIKGNIVSTYLTGRGVWSPRVANKFDGLEQYGFTKLGNIYHAQELAVRSYPEPAQRTVSQRLVAPTSARMKPAGDSRSPAEIAMQNHTEPRFTACACTPGGVLTNIYRNVPLASVLHMLYYVLLLVMRSAWEGSQTVVNCCVRDEIKNGGYYMNAAYHPSGLSRAACSVKERQQVMAWTHKKLVPYMRWD